MRTGEKEESCATTLGDASEIGRGAAARVLQPSGTRACDSILLASVLLNAHQSISTLAGSQAQDRHQPLAAIIASLTGVTESKI